MKQENVSTFLFFAGLVTAAVAQYFPDLLTYCVAVACLIIAATLVNYWQRVKKIEQPSVAKEALPVAAEKIEEFGPDDVVDWQKVFLDKKILFLNESHATLMHGKEHRDALKIILDEMLLVNKVNAGQWVSRNKKTTPAKERRSLFSSNANSGAYDTCF